MLVKNMPWQPNNSEVLHISLILADVKKIDTDVYEALKTALEIIRSRPVKGGIII